MKKPLWSPSELQKSQANITAFITFVNQKHSLNIDGYKKLYQWSVENISDFWADFLDFSDIVASDYETVVADLNEFPGARWFPGMELNFAENLLKFKNDSPAILFKNETDNVTTTTFLELYKKVASIAGPLRRLSIKPGDRVAAYMPNLPETVAAMLAATSAGAVWSSCGTELGAGAVISRLGQITPKVLFTVDGYRYKGKVFDMLPSMKLISKKIPSLERIIVLPYINETPDISKIPNGFLYSDFIDATQTEIVFEQLPFDHPVYIMFSSGTTGKPKCMVQSAGGILLNHLKELLLHTDLKQNDKIFYITSPSWMMWNWVVTSLAVGAAVVLYDGNPNYPDTGAMWRLIQDSSVTIFGCSASYIDYLKTTGVRPGTDFDLTTLREISQTGSPLSPEGFKYVYQEIKKNLHLNSISGGTDINGCFAAGSPIEPVYGGELQGPALAMKIAAYNKSGNPVFDTEGELVCEAPSPSMPLFFWNDVDGKKYHNAYFADYPGVWRHGDWIQIHSDTGGITFLGRSDYTLNPSGVRIGSAEIYNIVEEFPEVADSLVVGQTFQGDQRILLFIKMADDFALNNNLINEIKKKLRKQASPRHVPAIIFEVPEVPYTASMKKVESAVTNILNNKAVTNKDALINPACLDYYEDVARKLNTLK